jgi:hypothetical protein
VNKKYNVWYLIAGLLYSKHVCQSEMEQAQLEMFGHNKQKKVKYNAPKYNTTNNCPRNTDPNDVPF